MNLKRLLVFTLLTSLLGTTTFTEAFAQRNRNARRYGRNAPEVKNTLDDLIGTTQTSICEVNTGDEKLVLGTVFSRKGYIVTKQSEIKGVENLRCVFGSGLSFAARVVATQADYDLALLKIDAEVVPITIPEQPDVEAGNIVLSPNEDGQPMSMGLLTVKPRRFNIRPLTNNGTNKRGYLGVQCRPIDEGLRVSFVSPRTGAARAGLQVDDVIVDFEGESIPTVEKLIEKLSNYRPENRVNLQIKRADESLNVAVTLGAVPVQEDERDKWGGGPFSDKRFGFPKVIAHDSAIRPSQCGGPLLNSDGHVIGINIARALRISTYAVPIDVVKQFVDNNSN